MKLNRIIVCFLFLLVFQTGVFAADYVTKKLPSGQIVIVAENRDNPIVTINTWVKTGSINENDENSGVAHFLEHLFFKGSKNVPTGEFDKILESKGAITNAATSKDYTQFYITIPSKDFDTALKMHSDMLLNPLIPPEELEKERFVVIEEIGRGLDSPSNILYTNLFKLIYSNSKHPYMRPVIGTKDIIANIKREKILEFYNNWYTPDNMITVVSGDIDSKEAIKKIEQAFVQEHKKHYKNNLPPVPDIDKKISINEEKEVSQGYMAIAYKAPKFTNAKETYALDLLAVILGGSNGSILNLDMKEKKELVNSIAASYSQYIDDGLFVIYATFKPEKKSAVEKEIYNCVKKAKNNGITAVDLQKAKTILRTSTAYARESGANIAGELGSFTLYYGNPKMYDEYLKKIDEVKLEDVYAALNKFLIEEKTATSTVMPKGFVDISNAAAAAKIKPNSGELIDKTQKEQKYLLDNGATLILRKNKANSIIGIQIYSKGGAFIENKPGVSYFASQTAKRGTKNFNYEELNNYLDENGIEFNVSGGGDAFSYSLMTTKNKLDEGLYILKEVVRNANFPTAELEKTKNNYKSYAASLGDRPLAFIIDELSGIAYKGYPYSNNSKIYLQNMDSISRDDLVKYYDSVNDAKNVVITVAGDVDSNKMIKAFNDIFEEKNTPSYDIKKFLKPSYVPSENIVKKITSQGKETSWILVAYKTCPIYDVKEVATLRVIDSILGTGMSSRMFQSLREEKGLAYQVGTRIAQFGNDGSIFGYIGTNSKNQTQATEGLIKEFDKLKTEFVSEKELKEAKDKLLGNMILALETNMEKADFLSRYAALDFDLKFRETLEDAIQNVSASDILSFANKYFSKPYFLITAGQ